MVDYKMLPLQRKYKYTSAGTFFPTPHGVMFGATGYAGQTVATRAVGTDDTKNVTPETIFMSVLRLRGRRRRRRQAQAAPSCAKGDTEQR